MLFNSLSFIFVFLPVTCLAAWVAGRTFGHRAVLLVLLGASLFFYGFENPRLLLLISLSILVNHFIARTILARVGTGTAKLLLLAAIALNLGLLGYFKYRNFFLENVTLLTGVDFELGRLALPLGISFYTFQQIAYIVDCYRGELKQHDLLRYALFVVFFPQLVAGPIVHHKEMMPQLLRERVARFRADRVVIGLAIFALGLFKKTVIADNIGLQVSPVFAVADAGGVVTTADAWIATLSYTLQIYFDFSGYSDMAIGLGRLFGVRLPANFDSPYKATSIVEFWRRWHMTLSRFLRDYLYIPLGGNRLGEGRRLVNLMATMLIGGLWHGASWNFVIWGGLHGLFLVINHGWGMLVATGRLGAFTASAAWRVIGWALTMAAVMLAWVFFRAVTLNGALAMLAALAGLQGGKAEPRLALDLVAIAILAGGLAIALLAPNTQQIFRRYRPTFAAIRPPARFTAFLAWRYSVGWIALTAAIFGIAAFYETPYSEFLYWNF